MTMTNGMPNNFVDDICQDSNGFVWMATHGGLVRYDGYNYYYLGIGRPGYSLRSNSCRAIAEDGFKKLWVSFDEYTDILDLKTMQSTSPKCTDGKLEQYLKQILKEHSIRTFYDGKHLWIITITHIYALSFNEQGAVCGIAGMEHLTNAPDMAISLVYNSEVWMAFDSTIQRFVLPNNIKKGINSLKSSQSEVHVPLPKNLFVTAILSNNGAVWFSTNYGLYSYINGQLTTYRHTSDPTSIAHDYVTSLAISPSNRLLVGTLAGLDVFNDKNFDHLTNSNAINPLSSNFVNCLYSHNGIIWIGTETGGVTRFTPRLLQLENYSHNNNPQSLSHNAVNAMFAAPNGSIWIGTVEGGISIKAPGSSVFSHLTTSNSKLSHNSVSAFALDRSNRLWIGTWAGSLNFTTLDHPDQVRPLTVNSRYAPLLAFVGALAYDAFNDALWIGTNDGIFLYDLKKQTISEPFPDCRAIRGCIGALIDRNGMLWIGHIRGMVKIDLKKRKKGKFAVTHYNFKLDNPKSGVFEKIISFCQTKDGTIWIGSNAYGLYKRTVDKAGKETFKVFTVNDGLPNNSVKGIAEAPDGSLWITTENGLSLMNPETGVFSTYSEEDGLLCSQFYWNSALMMNDGRLLLGSEKGLTILSPQQKNANAVGKLTFTNLNIGNEKVLAGSTFLDEDISLAQTIYMHESDRFIDIAFSALNYNGEHSGTYSYQLEGYDDEWITLQPGVHNIHFSALPAGSYQLKVRYVSSASREQAEEISINIKVKPYFWRSWWFITLMLIILAVLAKYLYTRRLEELRRREAERLMRPIEEALKDSEEPDQLQTRIESILENQHKLKTSRQKSVEADRIEQEANQRPFMETLTEVMEEHYSDSTFGVGELADTMKMSRSILNKQILAETGEPTTQFMRTYRLEIAKDIILKNVGNRNITEIAYKVGFNDPKYFTRCFTKKYGASPSSFKA